VNFGDFLAWGEKGGEKSFCLPDAEKIFYSLISTFLLDAFLYFSFPFSFVFIFAN
jgi:hypothetical protein